MFADQEEATESSTDDDQSSDDGGQHFDERSPIHEVYWVACDANRRNGPQILQHDDLSVKGTDGGVSGVVDDYRFFGGEKKELIEEITGDKDMYGLRKYRQDFPEPDADMWAEHASEHYGIEIVDVHKIPADVASEQFNVDYSKDEIDPIFVPVLEDDNGNEVVYEPDDFYDAEDESDESDTEQAEIDEPDFPADAETAQEHLEEIPVDDLNKQEHGALLRLRDPQKTNDEIADEVDCSKNTVRKGLIKFLGDDGYDDLKERGKELQSDDYASKMSNTATATDGGEEGRIAELEARVERLENMFNSETLAEM